MYKIAVADDHILLRDALVKMLETVSDFVVKIRAAHGRELIDSLDVSDLPDLIILDINMPIMDGFDTIYWLNKHYPQIRILVLSMYDPEDRLVDMLKLGVRGFIKKDIQSHELKTAILSVMQTGYYYSPSSTWKLAGILSKRDSKTIHEKKEITDIERLFLKYVCSELTYKEIALAMNMNPRTIDNYRDSLFTKLGVRSRVALAIYAIKHGFVNIYN